MDPRFSVAPMMDWTDRHYRYLARLISKEVWLYTEMVTSGAICRTDDPHRFLEKHGVEHPVVLQLGGSDPVELAQAVKIAAQYDYDEINLNCGCPSPRVKRGSFGACLMAEPELVADCMQAMAEVATVPVTVKTRLGIDEQDDYEFLERFIDIVSNRGGVERFILHARKAWLNGLSPKENRTKPPLRYERVVAIKKEFPHLSIELNGGIESVASVIAACPDVDGYMIGRAAYQRPYMLAEVDSHLQKRVISEPEVVQSYISYAERELACGIRLNTLTKPLLGLFQGQPGARAYRRTLSEAPRFKGGIELIAAALACLEGVAA